MSLSRHSRTSQKESKSASKREKEVRLVGSEEEKGKKVNAVAIIIISANKISMHIDCAKLF